ncbi:MAG: GIY-YIG nuclease family protein [Verrucomicrobiales bacterium]|nr:GIY-YIG nuclease family protein [Verrucomicrobiales bacterium]
MSGFYYVYILETVEEPRSYYVGLTQDLAERLKYHNAGRVPHTSRPNS